MKKIILLVLSLLPLTLQAATTDPSVLSGKALFQKNCTACHAIQTRLVGPALVNVFDRHSENWIIKFVHSSQTMIKSGDTSATRLFKQYGQILMPDHAGLSDNDIKNIISYIRDESKTVVAQIPAVTATVEENDPYKGESGLVRQIVYIDLPGTHLPILATDYRTWFVIGSLILLSLIALFTAVRAKTMIIELNKKYGK